MSISKRVDPLTGYEFETEEDRYAFEHLFKGYKNGAISLNERDSVLGNSLAVSLSHGGSLIDVDYLKPLLKYMRRDNPEFIEALNTMVMQVVVPSLNGYNASHGKRYDDPTLDADKIVKDLVEKINTAMQTVEAGRKCIDEYSEKYVDSIHERRSLNATKKKFVDKESGLEFDTKNELYAFTSLFRNYINGKVRLDISNPSRMEVIPEEPIKDILEGKTFKIIDPLALQQLTKYLSNPKFVKFVQTRILDEYAVDILYILACASIPEDQVIELLKQNIEGNAEEIYQIYQKSAPGSSGPIGFGS